MDLARELRDRDVGVRELAREAGVEPATISRIASGKSQGYPKTRRAIRAALAAFPVVETTPAPPAPPSSGLAVVRNPNRRKPPTGGAA